MAANLGNVTPVTRLLAARVSASTLRRRRFVRHKGHVAVSNTKDTSTGLLGISGRQNCTLYFLVSVRRRSAVALSISCQPSTRALEATAISSFRAWERSAACE